LGVNLVSKDPSVSDGERSDGSDHPKANLMLTPEERKQGMAHRCFSFGNGKLACGKPKAGSALLKPTWLDGSFAKEEVKDRIEEVALPYEDPSLSNREAKAAWSLRRLSSCSGSLPSWGKVR
jgi:hypothetical protein